MAFRAAIGASAAGLLLSLGVLVRKSKHGIPTAAALMLTGFVTLGAGDWVREDLRKPYVIGTTCS